MAAKTPTAPVMPVGTILQAHSRLYFEVVRATAQTIWVQVLRTRTGRTPSGSWATVPIRGAYENDQKWMRHCKPTDSFVKIGIHFCCVYTGFAW